MLKTLRPGDVFGEMALLAGAPRMATVVARTEAQLVVVDRQVIDQEVRSIINEAAEFATHEPEPDASELYADVYAPMRS